MGLMMTGMALVMTRMRGRDDAGKGEMMGDGEPKIFCKLFKPDFNKFTTSKQD
jgi:hypothetical protein